MAGQATPASLELKLCKALALPTTHSRANASNLFAVGLRSASLWLPQKANRYN
jgi:hypothetical protein